MLGKLLKYDFRSMFKYWWIAAISSLALSLLGGICIAAASSEKELPAIVSVMCSMILILIIFGFVAFSILSMIFIFARFYKNFFTDEGYLTFTLPVKNNQLLNSKLISSTVTLCLTGVVLILNIVVMFLIGFADSIFTKEFWDEISIIFKEIINTLGIYSAVYVLEILILLVLSTIFSILFMFCCITFASIITKKAKVITAIGIYYGANSILSFMVQIFFLFGIDSISNWMIKLPENKEMAVIALIMLGIILFIALFCGLLYTLQYWMLDRKLNLN